MEEQKDGSLSPEEPVELALGDSGLSLKYSKKERGTPNKYAFKCFLGFFISEMLANFIFSVGPYWFPLVIRGEERIGWVVAYTLSTTGLSTLVGKGALFIPLWGAIVLLRRGRTWHWHALEGVLVWLGPAWAITHVLITLETSAVLDALRLLLKMSIIAPFTGGY